MMKSRSSAMVTLIAAAAMLEATRSPRRHPEDDYLMLADGPNNDPHVVKPGRVKPTFIREVKVPRPKSHKQFFVEGVEVWALNMKNAERKYRNMIKDENRES